MNDVNQTAKLICHAYLNLIPRDSIDDNTISKIINDKMIYKIFQTNIIGY